MPELRALVLVLLKLYSPGKEKTDMKIVFVGLVLAAAALSANAGDTSSTRVPQHSAALAATPMCTDGKKLELVWNPVTQSWQWECVFVGD